MNDDEAALIAAGMKLRDLVQKYLDQQLRGLWVWEDEDLDRAEALCIEMATLAQRVDAALEHGE